MAASKAERARDRRGASKTEIKPVVTEITGIGTRRGNGRKKGIEEIDPLQKMTRDVRKITLQHPLKVMQGANRGGPGVTESESETGRRRRIESGKGTTERKGTEIGLTEVKTVIASASEMRSLLQGNSNQTRQVAVERSVNESEGGTTKGTGKGSAILGIETGIEKGIETSETEMVIVIDANVNEMDDDETERVATSERTVNDIAHLLLKTVPDLHLQPPKTVPILHLTLPVTGLPEHPMPSRQGLATLSRLLDYLRMLLQYHRTPKSL